MQDFRITDRLAKVLIQNDIPVTVKKEDMNTEPSLKSVCSLDYGNASVSFENPHIQRGFDGQLYSQNPMFRTQQDDRQY